MNKIDLKTNLGEKFKEIKEPLKSNIIERIIKRVDKKNSQIEKKIPKYTK